MRKQDEEWEKTWDKINPGHYEFRNFAYTNVKYDNKHEMPKRPGFNQTGQACSIGLNSVAVKSFPIKTIYQYDVSAPRLSSLLSNDWH